LRHCTHLVSCAVCGDKNQHQVVREMRDKNMKVFNIPVFFSLSFNFFLGLKCVPTSIKKINSRRTRTNRIKRDEFEFIHSFRFYFCNFLHYILIFFDNWNFRNLVVELNELWFQIFNVQMHGEWVNEWKRLKNNELQFFINYSLFSLSCFKIQCEFFVPEP
jgi:hypothetical protein